MSSVRPLNLEILGVVLPHSHVEWSMLVKSLVLYLSNGIPSFTKVVNTSSPKLLSPTDSFVTGSSTSG